MKPKALLKFFRLSDDRSATASDSHMHEEGEAQLAGLTTWGQADFVCEDGDGFPSFD